MVAEIKCYQNSFPLLLQSVYGVCQICSTTLDHHVQLPYQRKMY